MNIWQVIYYAARTWFDFNILLPVLWLCVQAQQYLAGEEYEEIPVDEQGP